MSKSFRTQGGLTLVFILLCCLGAAALRAQTPSLTVQGILKKADGSAVPDDTYTVRFALFDAEVGGNEIWFEQLTDVETIGGVYSVVLGTHNKTLNAPFDKDYVLSVKIGGSSQELLPRPRLTPAPYAMSLLGAANKVPSSGTVQLYQITCAGNLNVGGETDLQSTVRVQTGALASTGSINSGTGPFHGFGFLGDGNTGYGSNSYGVASIWAGGQNVLNATNSDVTITKLLKLPNTITKTYTGSGNIYQLWTNGLTTQAFPVTNGYSMETDGVVKVGALHAMSDRRIKKDFALSNAASDLALLQRIRVTDYRYKDAIAKGNGLKKGVIAQELEQLVPEAIGLSTGIIPDIYALAQNARLEGSALQLSMETPHGLKAGDKVRLMAGDYQEELLVQATPSATAFTVSGWTHGAPEKVFVYGREVNDFHSVDYDYLFTMNISATQELARKVEALERENAAFKAQNAELRQLIEGIRAEVDALKGQQR